MCYKHQRCFRVLFSRARASPPSSEESEKTQEFGWWKQPHKCCRVKSWRRRDERHCFLLWWHLSMPGTSTHTKRVVTDLFPPWALTQTLPTVWHLWSCCQFLLEELLDCLCNCFSLWNILRWAIFNQAQKLDCLEKLYCLEKHPPEQPCFLPHPNPRQGLPAEDTCG